MNRSISYIPIQHQSLKILLSKLPSLEYLDIRADPDARLSKGVLTCKGAAQWCESLGKNCRLTHLNLRRHDLGQRAAEYLARALKKNHALQHLDLSFNVSFGSGIHKFVEGLRENNTLRDLLLNGCNVAGEGAACLARVLERDNRSIQRLHLVQDTPICNDMIEIFICALKKNHVLFDLVFDTDSAVNHPDLQKILQRNHVYRCLLALMSGFHPRLGRNSLIQNLASAPKGVMKLVTSFVRG